MAETEDDGAAQLLVAFSTAPLPAGGVGSGVGGAAGGGLRVRCLDPSHDAACGRCAGAPPLGDEQQYELVGDPGRKNGEKLLKSLLSRTPEWRSPEERAAAARACDASGHAGLARVMRGLDTSAALRKRDMLYLARIWNYRSYLWRPRVSRRRGEGRAEAAGGAHTAVAARGGGGHAGCSPPAPPAPLPPPLAALGLAELPPLVKLLLPMLTQQHAAAAAANHAAQAAYLQLLLSAGALPGAPAQAPMPAEAVPAQAPEAAAAAHAAAVAQLTALPPHFAALLAAMHAPPPPVQPDFAAAMAALGHAAPAV